MHFIQGHVHAMHMGEVAPLIFRHVSEKGWVAWLASGASYARDTCARDVLHILKFA